MKESVPADLFSAIDMVVMERNADGSFRLKGTALDWFLRFCPEAESGGKRLEPGKCFMFLENFLIDAEEFWRANASGLLKSGLWIESDASGNDCAFEAVAVSTGEKRILLLKLCWMTYAEKQYIIQKGRELGLEYHRIRRLEEALRSAQTDLKEKVKRRTAKLSESNELLRQEIEERKRAEKGLRESTGMLRAILAASPVGIGLVREDRTLEWANKAFHELVDHEEVSVSGKAAREFFHTREEWRVAALEIISGIERTGIGRVESKLLTSSGRELFCLLQGSPLDPLDLARGIIVVALDITDRKRAEEGRILLATAIEHAAESVIITDSKGAIQYVNPAFENTTGYNREEVVGCNPRVLKSGRQGASFYRAIWDKLAAGEMWSGHLTNRRKDGSLYEVDETISPVFDIAGNIVNYVAVKRDVTQEIRLEKQLNQAQKMEAIGTLSGGIAHDFNNILGAIIGYTELSMTHVISDKRLERNLKAVLKASMRAKELVQQILTMSRQSEQQLEPLEVRPIIREALRFLRASLPATIEIRQEISTGSRMVLSNATQIHQVLMNLCTNAAHSMREKGGIIDLGLSEIELGPEDVLLMPDLKPGIHLRLSVGDSGHGMDSSVLERLFDPYFTTKAPGEGTGLGLAVVQGIVKSHAGCITVTSEVGKGSLFEVFLPSFANLEQQQEEVAELPRRGSECILFVDDEATLAELGKEGLEALGYDVVAMTSSAEALAVFQAQPGRFDLVITDQTMPRMTGLVLARKVLEIRPNIPVILCTGYSEQVTKDSAREAGIRVFMMKPLIMRDLAMAIRRLLD